MSNHRQCPHVQLPVLATGVQLTRTFSCAGRASIKRVKCWVRAAKVVTVPGSVLSRPQLRRSSAVALWPLCSNSVTVLYQHHAPWEAPCTSRKWLEVGARPPALSIAQIIHDSNASKPALHLRWWKQCASMKQRSSLTISISRNA